jgi:hypothetical protein
MSDLGVELFGQPCRECGFSWDTDLEGATAIVAGAGDRYRHLLAGASGTERHPDLGWSVTAYVCHVVDNLRIWAERVAGIALGGPRSVAGCDEDALGDVRRYEDISLPAALWALPRAADDWLTAVRMAPPGLAMEHSAFGELTLLAAVLLTAHDTDHHAWDVERSLAAVRSA